MPSGPDGVPASEVLAELDALCAHREFARSRRQTAFLRYVVDVVLKGRGEELKEYTIATGALGKGADFDPTIDSSVRSEASRIRTKLEAIYASEPDAHPVRILLPKGHYQPTFERVSPAPRLDATVADPMDTAPAAAPREAAKRRSGAVGVLVVALLVGIGSWWLGRRAVTLPPSVQVTRFDGLNTNRSFPMISPDGTLVVFSQVQGAQPFLFLARRDGNPIALEQQGEHAAWSPDGRQLAFRSQRNGGGLFVMDMTTKEVRQVAPEGFHPAWSPDGQHLVYSSESFIRPEERPTTASVLSVVDLATRASRRLTMTPAVEDAIQPAWSPDGKWVAFWSVDSAGHRDIFIVAATGGTRTRITETAANDWNPVWSPDGRLYWSSNLNGAANLWRARIGTDGRPVGAAEQLALPSAYASFHSFDRTGELLYANVQTRSSVYRTTLTPDALSASEPVRVTSETLRVRHPAFSPDGQSFVAFTLDPREDLVVFTRDGTDMQRLTNDEFRDRGPEWSPDGQRIAFVSNRGGDYQLWSIRADGSSLQQITHHPKGAFVPIWSADGRQLAWFERGYRVFRTRIDAAQEAPMPVAPDTAFVHTAWWDNDRALLGELAANEDDACCPLVSYSLESKTFRQFGVRGHGPRWLTEGKVLLFVRANTFYAFDVTTKVETPLLPLPGDVDRRYVVFPTARTIYFLMEQFRTELWTARIQ